jgi:hypothetical protein
MTTSRTAYKIDEQHPGSDLAGETAAALASAAIAFRPYNSSYSNLLLVHAKQVREVLTTHILIRIYLFKIYAQCGVTDILLSVVALHIRG